MLMRLRMLKLSVGKGRQVMKQFCCRVLQYYATVATERAGYVLYRALVIGAMSSHHFALTLHLLLFLLVYADSANSQQAHYYITPSLSVHCPGDPCLTLPQLAANSTSYLSNETNVSLTFLQGNHSLDGELSLSHADNFSMTNVIGGNGTVFVECGSQSGRFR